MTALSNATTPAAPGIPGTPLALVTGASSGIGAAVARLLARRGFRTLLLARRMDRLAALARELSAQAPSTPVALDLAGSTAATEQAVARLLAEHGPASVLVNNAGGGHYHPFLRHTADDHHRLMQLNYFAAVATIRAVLPAMLAGRRGHIINVASISAKMGPWGHAGYAAAKAALVSLTQTLAAEHAGSGVHFSYVNPGMVRTEFFDQPAFAPLRAAVGRHGIAAEAVARGLVGLLDRPRLELCIPRHYRVLDLLKALSPRWTHRLVARQSRPQPGVGDRPDSGRPADV